MKPEIAIALSGGGYRAAMFHLGTLSYLHHLKSDSGESFLDYVNTLSTISGGTITGLWYMMQYARDNVNDASFAELYHKLRDVDIISPSIYKLLYSNGTSFIKEMIGVYDEVFFNNACFRLIQDKIDSGHIHHFSANGTDFSNGLAFRFQASRKIVNIDPDFSRGIIGNIEHRIPWDVAGNIKLSEILAVSSCFPGGFEPLYFPTDFNISSDESLKDYISSFSDDIPLMDGGIVDNQGIEPILLANAQMQYDDPRAKGDNQFPCHDLIIVSDVAYTKTVSMHGFSSNKFKTCSISDVDCLLCICVLFGIVCSVASFLSEHSFIFGFVLCLTLVLSLLRILTGIIKHICSRQLKKAPVKVDIRSIWNYPVNSFLILLVNRGLSLFNLSKAVFMKPIRQMRYKALYENSRWKNRRIMNAIYELTADSGSWKNRLESGSIPEWLAPSEEIQKNSRIATNKGTTLWFTDEDRSKGIPEALLACGQYNICMNLLEYIQKLRKDDSNTTEAHAYIMQYEEKLKSDWEKFKKNPKWMVFC